MSTTRLANILDAVEDAWLLRRAVEKSSAAVGAQIAQLVRSPTDHTDDALLFEKVRRTIAKSLL